MNRRWYWTQRLRTFPPPIALRQDRRPRKPAKAAVHPSAATKRIQTSAADRIPRRRPAQSGVVGLTFTFAEPTGCGGCGREPDAQSAFRVSGEQNRYRGSFGGNSLRPVCCVRGFVRENARRVRLRCWLVRLVQSKRKLRQGMRRREAGRHRPAEPARLAQSLQPAKRHSLRPRNRGRMCEQLHIDAAVPCRAEVFFLSARDLPVRDKAQ